MNRMKELRELKAITQDEIAALVGIKRSTYTNIENGKPTRIITLQKIANVLGVPIQQLLSEESVDYDVKNKIPVLGSVPAGKPVEAIEDIEEYIDYYPRFVKHGELFALRVKGNSMEPDLRSGDIAIIEKQDYAESGDIVVVRVNGEDVTLKRIKINTSGVMLIPTNKMYDPIYFSQKQVLELPVTIIGRVIEVRRRF